MRLQPRIHLSQLALVFPLVIALTGPATAVSVSDAWVTTRVKIALITDEGVSARAVNVDTIDGRVTLHGTVASTAEKMKAEQVARDIPSVRELRNLLQVVPPRAQELVAVTDAKLAEDVKAALKAEPVLRNSDIEVVSVHSGVVLLGGEADTLSDAYGALEVAARVEGVVRVASEIRSPDELGDAELWRSDDFGAADQAGSTARDRWITTATKMRLMTSTETPGFDINVDTRDGIVTLFGVVESSRAKEQAALQARKVSGVRQVVNDLQVVAPGLVARVEREDEDLEESIEKRIESDAALSDSDIEVEVSAGVARLSGTVTSRGDQVAALTAARVTPGVRRVIDDLRLAPPVSLR